MGEASNNPDSKQFKGRVVGPAAMPKIEIKHPISVHIEATLTPGEKWVREHGAAHARGEEVPAPLEEESTIHLVIMGTMFEKSALTPPTEWRNGGVRPIARFHQLSFEQARKLLWPELEAAPAGETSGLIVPG